jgi:glucose 1-dehydrogenase
MALTDLSGKTALVTGAARGIGKAIALELARCGADLVLCDLLPQVSDTAREIEALKASAVARITDAGDRKSIEKLFSDAADRYGAVDILVNNVGLNIRKPLWELEVSDVEAIWSTTLWSVFHCSQLAARQMRDRDRGGSIVCISSVLGSRPYAGSSAYNGAKAAVNQMVRTWASELAPHRIRVNAIEPGWIDTPGERVFASEEEIQTKAKQLPFGRLGTPEEIADAVAFLVSDYATYITGACLRVDGGYSLVH